MDNNELLNRYKKAYDSIKAEDKSAYSFTWLFIKELIEAAYGINDAINTKDIKDMNSIFINEYVKDHELREKLHYIRKARNKYEHDDISSVSQLNSDNLFLIIEKVISYANKINPNKFQLKNADIVDFMTEETKKEKTRTDIRVIIEEIETDPNPILQTKRIRSIIKKRTCSKWEKCMM